MTSSAITRAACLAGVTWALLLSGCDGKDDSSGTAGSGGTGASGGTAGSGGTGASGGTGGSGGSTGGGASGPQDILTTDLQLDLAMLTATAKVVVQPAQGASDVTLEVKGLTLGPVTVDGAAVAPTVNNGIASIPVEDTSQPVTVDISYSFPMRPSDGFDGWMPDSGVTFLWPYFCSNLFPCNSYPDDGVTFTMAVTGVTPGLVPVFPAAIPGDAPSYMPAVAVGDFMKLDLGQTTAGTKVSTWYLPSGSGEATAQAGTANLRAVFDYYEKTYGKYTFGPEVASVAANWGPGAYGGMEHHPFWHVGDADMGSEEVHAHEAAHGWFGDGVRITCWEDFVLSEGTVTYMAAHSLEEVGGPNIWPSYVDSLDAICMGLDVNTIALPSTCNEIDILNDDLWSLVPYIKGACFYEDVADLVGQDVLDSAIQEMYSAHVGKAAKMRDMIDTIEAKADPAQKDAIETLVTEWLLTKECPSDYVNRCGMHTP